MPRVLAVALMLVLACLSAAGQTPATKWGPWIHSTVDGRSVESRARCEYSVGSDSLWAYEFRNLTNETVDIVEREQEGASSSRVNRFSGASMFTLEAGKVSYGYETTLHGRCGAIPALRFEIVCVVPHGQDNPCFKNLDGSLVAAKSTGQNGVPSPEAKSIVRTVIHFDAGPMINQLPEGYVDRRLTASSIIGKWSCNPYMVNASRTAVVLREDIVVPLELKRDGSVAFGISQSRYEIDDLQVAQMGRKLSARWDQDPSSYPSIEGGSLPSGQEHADQLMVYAFFANDAVDNTKLSLILWNVRGTSQSPVTDYVCKWN